MHRDASQKLLSMVQIHDDEKPKNPSFLITDMVFVNLAELIRNFGTITP